MAPSQFVMNFVVFTIYLLWPNRAAESTNASFSSLPNNMFEEISSYLSATESAKVFRFINKKCDKGHRQRVIAKVDQFQSLLERIHLQSLDDAQFTAKRIIASFHELKLSELFAFEGPRILREWIDAMRKRRESMYNGLNPPGLTDLYRSIINSMTSQMQLERSPENVLIPTNTPRERFVDLLIVNSHRTFQHLLIPQSDDPEQNRNQRIHLMASLLLNECLWERTRDVTGLPPLEDLFRSMDCVGHHHDALKGLVETAGLILIHPSHHKSSSTPLVVDDLGRRVDVEIHDEAKLWMARGLVAFPDAEMKKGTDDVSILWMIKTIENGARLDSDESFYAILVKLFEPESDRWVLRAFEVLTQSSTPLFSEALRRFVDNADNGGFKKLLAFSLQSDRVIDDQIIEVQQRYTIIEHYFEIFGTAIDVITVPKSERRTLCTKWSAVLAQIALNWINGNRGVAMRLMLLKSRRLEMYYGDGEGRMNRENLIKIQEAFPWLMTDDLIDALLRMKAETTNSHVIQ